MSKSFRLAAALAAAVLSVSVVHAAEITGAGASFPAPLYSKWAAEYQKATGNKVNYQSIGSAGGIRQINAKTVDFGASDMPLKPEDLDKSGLMQFPAAVGGVVPVFNLPGIQPGQLKLTGVILADIYLGKITKWNDVAIAKLNPGVKLPEQTIAVVRRADGSGTSFIFTNYLSKVSDEWKSKVGEGTTVSWPVGTGGKGNEGVASFVQRISGAIGYVEFAYAKQTKMPYASMQNAEGAFVQPDDATFRAAAAGANWDRAAFYEILTNQPGKDAWPITGATFILLQKAQDKPAQATEVVKFFSWAYANGAKMASDLDYVPIPDAVVKLINAQWQRALKDTSGKPVALK